MKTITTKMLELAATPCFETLSSAEQDQRFEELLAHDSTAATTNGFS